MDIGNLINDNIEIFIGVFAVVCVVIIAFLIWGAVRRKAQKKKFLEENANLVEIVFDTMVQPPARYASRGEKFSNPGATSFILHSVNGREPQVTFEEGGVQIFGRSVYVPAGEATLDCEYYVLTNGKNFATLQGRDTCTIPTALGNRYLVSFDLLDKKLRYKVKPAKNK